ncbi:MAG: single-stranded DNA-binding protein [Gammaproteobacteria bacterium]|nr:single-stranded DNA-binding protein [Gammaproteobacteria bacterium]
MSLVNSCRFLGRLGAEPDMQYTPTGTAIVKVGIAVNERRKDGDEWVDDTLWVDLTLFGAQAENLSKVVNKGDLIQVDCQYQKRAYTSNEGEKRTNHDFIVREWNLVARKLTESVEYAESDVVDDDEDDEDELPF